MTETTKTKNTHTTVENIFAKRLEECRAHK